MGGNLFAKIMRYLDTCAQFFLAHRDNLGAGVSDEFVTRDVEFHIVDVFAAAKTYGANDLVDTIKPAVASVKGKGGDLLDNAIKANVAQGVDRLKGLAPLISEGVQAGKVKIVGAVYDLQSGKVTVLA